MLPNILDSGAKAHIGAGGRLLPGMHDIVAEGSVTLYFTHNPLWRIGGESEQVSGRPPGQSEASRIGANRLAGETCERHSESERIGGTFRCRSKPPKRPDVNWTINHLFRDLP